MTRLTDERLRDIESWAHKLTPLSAPILGEQIGSMARELLLLRAECRAGRLVDLHTDTGDLPSWLKGYDEYKAARNATDAAGFTP